MKFLIIQVNCNETVKVQNLAYYNILLHSRVLLQSEKPIFDQVLCGRVLAGINKRKIFQIFVYSNYKQNMFFILIKDPYRT